MYTHTHTHTRTDTQSLYNTALKKSGCKKGEWREGVCYSIQYEQEKGNSQSVHKTHFFFTVKPTLLNINILHPKVSAVPSAQASPGPHAWSTLHPVYARPGPKKITVSTLHTNLFTSVLSLISHFLYGLHMSVCVFVCECVGFFFATQYLKSPAVKYKSLRVGFSTN